MRTTAVLLLLLTSSLFAQEPQVILPSEIKDVIPGQWVPITPSVNTGGKVKWKTSKGLTQVDLAALFGKKVADESLGIVVYGPKGTYEVTAWCAKGDVASELAVVKVVIGNDVDPDKPDPDKPVPATEWQKAYNKEPATVQVNTPNGVKTYTREKDKLDLEQLYRQIADMTLTSGYDTWGKFEKYASAATKNLLNGRLNNVGQLVQAELKTTFGKRKSDDPLSEGDGQKIAACFTKIADHLKDIKEPN